jgi:hypothetical protein
VSDTWLIPEPIGKRLCWRWNGENTTIPIVEARPLHTDGRGMEHGWHSKIPSENGAVLDLTFDPDRWPDGEGLHLGEEGALTLWLYVRHAVSGRLIEANVRDDHVIFDARCPGISPGPSIEGCDCRDHGVGQWWEYIHEPQQVKNRMLWLGRLPLRAMHAPERVA